jgi:uncharacterized protein YegL
MSIYDDLEGVARRSMTLFFLIDASGSMKGSKIGAVNEAILNVVPELRDVSENNADALVKIAALAFSTGARWMYETPVEAEKFQWSYIDAGGLTDMGEAFKMLEGKLSKKEFMRETYGAFAPALFLLSDGAPTDDYKNSLEKLRKNNWFKHAIKVAVAIGDDADRDMLAEFTGNPESVLITHTPEALKRMIKFVSVTASKIASQSASVGAKSKEETFIEQAKEFASVNPEDLEADNW